MNEELEEVSADEDFVRTAMNRTLVVLSIHSVALVAGTWVLAKANGWFEYIVSAVCFGIAAFGAREMFAAVHDGAESTSILNNIIERVARSVINGLEDE